MCLKYSFLHKQNKKKRNHIHTYINNIRQKQRVPKICIARHQTNYIYDSLAPFTNRTVGSDNIEIMARI